jgi:FkbM family methyltransferase
VFAELNLSGKLIRYCISSPQSRWRVNTLFTKEPTTIDWLHSFKANDVMVDIGANIGMYAIYAGVIMGARVFAFEPESQNYAEMCRSVFLNAAHQNILAYCVAMNDKPVDVSRLLLNTMVTGGSFHDFGEPSRDYHPSARFAQGSVAFSLDYLCEIGAVPLPQHIKIDVDGHEKKVFNGMQQVLQSDQLQTVLLECDPKLSGTYDIVQSFIAKGWLYNPDQVRLASSGLRPAPAVIADIEQGNYAGNIIFARKAEQLSYATAALDRFSASDIERMSVSA